MKKFAPILVLIASVLWGSIGPFVRVLTSCGLSNWQILEVSLLLSSLLCVIILAIYDRSLLRIAWRDLWCFIGAGVIGVLLISVCYYATIEITSLSIAAVLLFTAPIFVTILSVPLFGERITSRKVVALVCAIAGCLLVSGALTGQAALSLLGIVVGLGAGFGQSLFSIFSRYAVLRGYHPFTITTWTFIMAGVAGFAFTDWGSVMRVFATAPTVLWVIPLNSVLTFILPCFLYTVGLRYLETSIAAILTACEPVTATLLGMALYHEIPDILTIAGILLVIISVVILSGRGNDKTVDASVG